MRNEKIEWNVGGGMPAHQVDSSSRNGTIVASLRTLNSPLFSVPAFTFAMPRRMIGASNLQQPFGNVLPLFSQIARSCFFCSSLNLFRRIAIDLSATLSLSLSFNLSFKSSTSINLKSPNAFPRQCGFSKYHQTLFESTVLLDEGTKQRIFKILYTSEEKNLRTKIWMFGSKDRKRFSHNALSQRRFCISCIFAIFFFQSIVMFRSWVLCSGNIIEYCGHVRGSEKRK